jgi:hypothetical protein
MGPAASSAMRKSRPAKESMASLHDGLATMSTDGEVANALVCKTSIHGFKSHSVLQQNKRLIHIFRVKNPTTHATLFSLRS